MAAKKDKAGIESLRTDIQSLADAFYAFKDAMLTDAAVEQAERQQLDASLVAVSDLASVADTDVSGAAALMAAIGHPLRLRMVLMLAHEPTSVTAMVERLSLRTTGAAYHHMNVLMSNGIATQPERGIFALAEDHAPHVHRILGALFGIEKDTEPEPKSGKKKKNKA